MATIQRPVKTFGTRSYATEVAAAPNNEAPILSGEVDADLDTIYTAWNTPANRFDWVTSGAGAIAPSDPTKIVALAAVSDNLQWKGPSPQQGRLQAYADEIRISLNRLGAGTFDDTTKPSWFLGLYGGASGDRFRLARGAPNVQPVENFSVDGATGKTTCTLADKSVTGAMLAVGAGQRSWAGTAFTYAVSSNINSTANVLLLRSAALACSGGVVLVFITIQGLFYPNIVGRQAFVVDIYRNPGAVGCGSWLFQGEQPANGFTTGYPTTTTIFVRDQPAAGSTTWEAQLRVGNTGNVYRTGDFGSGSTIAIELP